MTDPGLTERPSRPSGRTRRLPAPPWLVFLVAGFYCAILVVALLNGRRYVDVGATFALPSDGSLVVTGVQVVTPLRPGDRIVHAEGEPADLKGLGAREGLERLRHIRFGPKTGMLRVEAARGEQRIRAELPRTPFLRVLPTLVGVALVVLCLLTAVALALARTDDTTPRYLLLYLPIHGLACSGALLVPPGMPVDALGDAVLLLAIAAIVKISPGVVLALLTVFPTRLPLPRWVVPVVLVLFSLIPAAWGIVTYERPTADNAYWPSVRAGWLNLVSVALGLLRFLHGAFALPEGPARAGARIVIFPTCLFVAAHLFIVSFPTARNIPPPVSPVVDALMAMLIPISFAIAVSQRKLFEIDRLIRRSAGYVVASSLLLGVFLLTAPGVATVAAALLPHSMGSTHAIVGLLAVGCFLLLNPLRRRVQQSLDRLFYRSGEDPGRLVAAGFVAAARSGSSKEAARGMLETTAAALHPEFQRIWIFGDDSAVVFEPPAGLPREAEPYASEATTGPRSAPIAFLELDERHAASCLAAVSGPARPLTPAELRDSSDVVADALVRAGVALVVPIPGGHGAPLGLWALGEKKSEEDYSPDEGAALLALASGLSLSIERDRLASRVAFEQEGRRGIMARLSRTRQGLFAECPRCGRCFDEEVACPDDGARAGMIHAFPRVLADRYRLDHRLGTGGMGVVFRAWDSLLRRDVAVKLIRDQQLTSDTSLLRFRREARLAARLAHPNAVTVYDAGELSGVGAYYVMELLAGCTLAREIAKRGRLPWPEAVEVLSDVLAALAAAHTIGLVHRDVKPGNVLLVVGRNTRQTKLMDFGLAMNVSADSMESEALTRPGALLGTPGYIAPELARGESASPLSDLWAAAVLGYEMLAGERPFRGKSALEMLDRARREEYRPLATAAPGAPESLADLLEAALAAEPRRRPQSAAAMRELLIAARA